MLNLEEFEVIKKEENEYYYKFTVVTKELNRKYIGCDINPRAVEITNKRLNDIKIGG